MGTNLCSEQEGPNGASSGKVLIAQAAHCFSPLQPPIVSTVQDVPLAHAGGLHTHWISFGRWGLERTVGGPGEYGLVVFVHVEADGSCCRPTFTSF